MCEGEEKRMCKGKKEREKRKKDEDLREGEKKLQIKKEEEMCPYILISEIMAF